MRYTVARLHKELGKLIADGHGRKPVHVGKKIGRLLSITETEKRFWSKVQKTGGCWFFVGGDVGQMRYAGLKIRGDDYITYAHRISWEIHFGPIPEGMCVLHRCDVPKCVNPDHLWIGTKQDNIADMVKKGRHAVGEKQHKAKLRESDVVEIRALYETGKYSHQDLATMFNVHRSTIGGITRRTEWRHVR